MAPSDIIKQSLSEANPVFKNNMHNILIDFNERYVGGFAEAPPLDMIDLLFTAFVAGMACVMGDDSHFNTKFVVSNKKDLVEPV